MLRTPCRLSSREEPQRVLARRLSVFPGGATLAAAEWVCADSDGLPAASILAALSGLVDKSILIASPDPGGGGSRYRMLETVRAYGAERLAEAGEEDRVRSSFAAYCLHLAETADAALRTADQVRWFSALTVEQDNLHAAVRCAIAGRDSVTAYLFARALGCPVTMRWRSLRTSCGRQPRRAARRPRRWRPPTAATW
jgi:predicted ATPase